MSPEEHREQPHSRVKVTQEKWVSSNALSNTGNQLSLVKNL